MTSSSTELLHTDEGPEQELAAPTPTQVDARLEHILGDIGVDTEEIMALQT